MQSYLDRCGSRHPDDGLCRHAGRGVEKYDAGKDWFLTNMGLTDTDVRPLLIDPSNHAVLFVGTEGGGVFRSINGGKTWTPFNNGMPPRTHVYSLAANFTASSIFYAGTDDGIFFLHQVEK